MDFPLSDITIRVLWIELITIHFLLQILPYTSVSVVLGHILEDLEDSIVSDTTTDLILMIDGIRIM